VLRGGHLGQQVLRLLIDAAAQRGEREVMLHAQRSAEGFYRRLGFEQRGEPFEEAGIAHLDMFMRL
jgi:predicted GNAT family N-acyltransferase